jgi:hypothetical protein
MLNLLIGISGGIFSSIIVSRIFLISTDYKEQIQRIQNRVEVTFCLSGSLWCLQELYKDGYVLSNDFKTKLSSLIEEERKCYNQMIFDDLEDELHELAIDYNDFIENINVNKLDALVVDKKIEELDDLTKRFYKYKNSHKKTLRKLLLRDKILRYLFIIFIVIIMLTVIA